MARALLPALLLGALRCASPPPPTPSPCGEDNDAPAPTWSAPTRLTFGDDGLTAAVTPGGAWLSLTLNDPTRCAQVESAVADGRTLVPAGARGIFCTDCAHRVMGLVGGGLWSFDPGAVTLRFGVRDCATWVPIRGAAPLGASLRVSTPALDDPAQAAVLRVNVAAFGDLWLRDVTAVDALLAEASSELAGASISLQRSEFCAISSPAERLEITDSGHAEVARWTSLARARCPALRSDPARPRLTLLVAPCVRTRDSVRGESRAVDGYTTHIPGGALSEETPDAVLLSAGCGATLPVVHGVPLGLGRVLAHEVGHFLGLFHTSEAEGARDLDAFDDTDERNLMNAVPLRPEARGLSRAQVAVARRHPWLRRSLRGACAGR